MCAIWTLSGWYIVATRTFSTKPRRVPFETTVEGWGAVLMGSIFILLGLIALAVLLERYVVNKRNRRVVFALAFAVPAVVALTL